MAVVIPYTKQTWTDGVSSCSAARNNVHEDGINDAHYMPAVRVGRAAALSVTTSTWTLVPWTNEAFDTAGNAASTMHDNSTNPARLIARYAGKYQVNACVGFAVNTTGERLLQVQKNTEALPGGADWGDACEAVTNDIARLNASFLIDLAVNDYIACVVWQNSGGALDVTTASQFSMVRVA